MAPAWRSAAKCCRAGMPSASCRWWTSCCTRPACASTNSMRSLSVAGPAASPDCGSPRAWRRAWRSGQGSASSRSRRCVRWRNSPSRRRRRRQRCWSATTRACRRSTGRLFRRGAAGCAEPAGPERVGPAASVHVPEAGFASGPVVGAGHGFAAYPELQQRLGAGLQAVHASLLPSAAGVLRLAELEFAAGRTLPPEGAQPTYIRDDVARPRGTGG